jgi:hypothetical protein
MPSTTTRPRRKLKSAFFVFLVWGAFALVARADQWALMVEPSFMDHKMRRPIAGSQRTILAVVRVAKGEVSPLTREEKKSVHMTFEQIRSEALKTASDVLAHITPQIVRDKKKVIRYAVLASENPLTASCVLAPEFAATFRDTLGPDLIVAMPNRNQVLVFSKQDDAHLQMAETIINGYLTSNYPVSRELFALENGSLRSLGELQ